MVADFKRTVGTHWVEEMTNFNQKTVAVSLLMFITVIAPTLTFGAVYGTNTENNIGAVETILATCWMGCFFSLFGGMPTVIVGSTGPVLIMTTVIYDHGGAPVTVAPAGLQCGFGHFTLLDFKDPHNPEADTRLVRDNDVTGFIISFVPTRIDTNRLEVQDDNRGKLNTKTKSPSSQKQLLANDK